MPTSERIIETPSGPVIGTINERLEVLGVSSYLTQTGNLSNARSQFREFFDITNVPIGTITITSSVDKWAIGYGSLDPELLDELDPNANPQWRATDHNIGLARVQVSVTDINSPNLNQNPPRQSARVVVSLNLLDGNGDDDWFGIVGYTLTFLGRSVPRAVIVGNTAREYQGKVIWHGHYDKKDQK